MRMRKMGLLFLLCFFILTVHGFSSLYHPFRLLKTYSTDHFEWIFPEESTQTALRLAYKAEGQYSNITRNLRFQKNLRIPVVLTPDSELLNGYFTPLPMSRVALYEVSPEVNSSLENLKGLSDVFFHELTHAVSLNIRAPFFQFFSDIFSDVITPGGWMMPMWMVEGVTVSFESLDGNGRVNDPRIREKLIQDVSEGRFFRIDELSGAYDGYRSSAFYEYGGFFNAYLQKTYGMDRYAQLWKEAGNGNIFVGLSGVFEKVYQKPLDVVWIEFETNFYRKIPQNLNRVVFESSDISLLKSAKSGLYYLDRREGGIFFVNPNVGKERSVLELPGILSFDVNSNDTKLLVTLAILEKGGVRVASREYDLQSRSWVGKEYRSIREAVYGKNGEWLGIKIRGEQTDLVRVQNNRLSVVYKGVEGVLIGNPVRFGERLLVVIRVNGTKHLAEFNNGQWTVLQLSDNNLETIRDLQVIQNTLLFTDVGETGFSRIGRLWQNKVVFGQEWSGGAASPVMWNNKFYYVGHFRRGSGVLAYPDSAQWKNQEILNRATLSLPEETPVSFNKSNIHNYSVFMHLNPFSTWLPVPVFGTSGISGGIEGMGIYTYMQDPTETLVLQSTLGYNWKRSFFPVSLNLTFSGLLPDINLFFKDRLTSISNVDYRFTGGGVSVNMTGGGGWYNLPWNISLGFDFEEVAPAVSLLPYEWGFSNRTLVWSLNGSIGKFYRGGSYWKLWGNILSMRVSEDVFSGHWRTEAQWSSSPYRLPLKWKFFGGWSDAGLFHPDGSMEVFGSSWLEFAEYSGLNLSLSYYVAGEADVLLFNWEMQNQAGMFPLYFRRFFSLVGYRTFYAGVYGFYQSIFADFTQGLAFPIGAISSGTLLDLTLETGYAIDQSDPQKRLFLNVFLSARY